MSKLKISAFFAVLIALSHANANHYGMAGCGIGSLAFHDQPGNIQIVAATLNNIISPQTSAITSGTSGCYEEGAETAKLNYIETNIVSLKEDAARGQGETLDGLMTLMGCEKSQPVKEKIKSNYKQIFNNQSPTQVLKEIESTTNSKQMCNNVG